jgi:hypothetical protein
MHVHATQQIAKSKHIVSIIFSRVHSWSLVPETKIIKITLRAFLRVIPFVDLGCVEIMQIVYNDRLSTAKTFGFIDAQLMETLF